MAFSANDRVALGKSGLKVTRVSFGTAGLGNMPETFGFAVSDKEAEETLAAVFASPINCLDTSRNYGMGEAERRIGRAIRANGGLPKDFVLATKLDRDFQTNKFDASRARRSLEESLETLGIDHIPLLHFHDPEYASSLDDVTRKGGALDELFKMKSEGLCQAVGLGAGRTDIMMDLIKDYPFDVVLTHNRYTIVNRHAGPLIDACAARGIAVFNAAPYASGVLAQGSATYKRYVYQEATDEVLAPVRAVEAVCAKHGVPTGAVALQFSMRNKNLASTICGVTKPEFVKQTIEWASFPIPEAVWNELASVAFSTDDPEASRTYVLG